MKSFKALIGRDSNPTRARHVHELLQLWACESLVPWLRARHERVVDFGTWEMRERAEIADRLVCSACGHEKWKHTALDGCAGTFTTRCRCMVRFP